MLPPGLSRSISDCTSPFGAYPSPDVLRNLEVYFADPRSTDAVYEGLLSRAYTEPISVPLVEKVVALLKAYLLRFVPSADAATLLEEFAFRVQELKDLSPAGRSAVAYVRSCLRQLKGERPGGLRGLRGSGSTSSLRGSWGRSREDLPRFAADGRFPGVKVSVSSTTLGRANDRYAAADALPSPTDADAGMLPAWLRQSSGKGSRGWEELSVPSPQQTALGAEPAWAVPARPLQLPPPPPGATPGRAWAWMRHLPDLAPRVTFAPSPSGSLGGAPAPPAPALSLSGSAPINVATIHRCVLDLEEPDIGRHLAEVLGEARSEALQQQTPGQPQRPARAGRSGGGAGHHRRGGARHGPAGRRARPGRLLFHHPPYNRSEQLPMLEADVAVVVEAVCGVRAASALAAVQGPVGSGAAEGEEENPATAAAAVGQPEGMWQAAFEEDPDFAQMCGGILMKLIVDLWLRVGPVGAYTLVLRMLRAALRSGQPATRARAFDVLYNLAVHGAMLRGEAEETALAAAAAEAGAGGGAGGVQLPWQVCSSAPLSPFTSGGGGLTPPPAPRPPVPASTPPPAQTPPPYPTAATGGSKDPLRHLTSHSLGLAGSALLDSGGSLSGMAAAGGLPGRAASKGAAAGAGAGAGADGLGGPPTAVKDGPRPPAPPPSPAPSVPPAEGRASQQQLGVGVSGSGGGGGSDGGGGGAAVGYDSWLRALLFQLLCDIDESCEYAEEVWRAAMGCTAHLCSHGGHWVAAWVQHLPPPALAGLLRAACFLNWSQELYAQLLKLVPFVLVRPAAAAAGAAAAQPPAPPSAAGTPTGRRPDSPFAAPTAVPHSALAAAGDPGVATASAAAAEAAARAQRLEAFGGLSEIQYHFMRAPTPDSRAALLTALVYCCCGGVDGMGSGVVSLSVSGDRFSGAAGGGGGGGGLGPDAGPVVVLALLQGLHLDSVCLALRAALQRPWPHMSSRLADVLASAVGPPHDLPGGAFAGLSPSHSHSASASASADYAASPAHTLHAHAAAAHAATLTAGLASTIAARKLLRPLLEALEEGCAAGMASPQDAELRTAVDVSLAHVGGGALAGPVAPPPLTPTRVAAAWRLFREVCSSDSAEDRQVALHWLHKLLSTACRSFQGQLLLLSPLSLKTSPEANKLAAATATAASHAAAAASPAQPQPPPPRWNASLADALLHVVREAPLGCELLMGAVARVVADQKAHIAAAAAGSAQEHGLASPPRSAAPPLGQRFGTPAPPPATPAQRGDAAAAAGGPEEAAMAACRRVMELYYVGLQWMLQCGSAETRMPAVLELADAVLMAVLQPDPAAAAAALAAAAPPVAHGGGAAGGAANSSRSGGLLPHASAGRGAAGGSAGSSILAQLQPQLSQSAASAAQAAGAAAATAAPQHAQQQQELGGGMLISQQLLSGLMAFDPDALACTPPELLVSLLQQCSQSVHEAGGGAAAAAAAAQANGVAAADGAGAGRPTSGDSAGGGYRSMHRGFIGRPCAVEGLGAGTAAGCVGAGATASGGRVGAAFAAVRLSGSGGGETGPSGAAVGPWQDDWQDRRLALLLSLMARCSLDPEAFAKYSLSHVIKAQLSCEDLRCRYYAGVYLLKHWRINQQDKYWRMLRHIIGTAQQLNDERLLDNPYLQMRAMLNVDHA